MWKWKYWHIQKQHKNVWRKSLIVAKKLEHCITKLNTHMRNVFLCSKLENTRISLVAGDFFVKLEALIHVQEHRFQIPAKYPKKLHT